MCGPDVYGERSTKCVTPPSPVMFVLTSTSAATLNVTDTMCERPGHDDTKRTNIVCGITGGLAVVAVALRTWHAISNGIFEKDDLCALAAGVFVIIDNGVTFPTGPAGFGKDTWNVPFENITFILKV